METSKTQNVLLWRTNLVDNAVMSNERKRTKKPAKTLDQHKPARMTRVKEIFAVQLDKIVELNGTDFATEVNRAVRELLARENLWPPLQHG